MDTQQSSVTEVEDVRDLLQLSIHRVEKLEKKIQAANDYIEHALENRELDRNEKVALLAISSYLEESDEEGA